MARVKISELPELNIATLDTTYVAGVYDNTTYRIPINRLTSSLDTTFATDLVVNAISGTINTLATTASLNSLSTSIDNRLDGLETFSSSADNRYILSGSLTQTTWENISGKPNNIVSSSTQISDLGYATTSSVTTISASAWGAFQSASSYSSSLATAISASDAEYTSFSASLQSTITTLSTSVDSRLDTLESFSSSQYKNDSSSFDNRIIIGQSIGGYIDTSNSAFTYLSSGSSYNIYLNSPVTLTYQTGKPLYITSFDKQSRRTATINSFEYDSGIGAYKVNATILDSTSSIGNGYVNKNYWVVSLAQDGYLTTNSYTIDSASFSTRIINAQPIGYLTTSSYQIDSASFNSRIISGSAVAGTISSSAQISGLGYSTTSSLNSFTSSYKTDSASFDTRINSITLSGSNLNYLLEAYANVTYTLPGTFTEDPCRYSIVSVNENVPSSWFDTSTYTFTPQKAGYWEIVASYDVYRNSEASMAIKKNGSIVAAAGSFNAVAQQVIKIVYLNGSTDYINITNVGGSAQLRAQFQSRSWFQARWVGE